MSNRYGDCDVLVVGAGPTGLTLASQLAAFGVRFRVIDSSPDRTSQSRALAVQPRSLEVLRSFGVADELVRQGNPAVELRVHAGGRSSRSQLFDIGLDDTAYPFLLFLSQARTEKVLIEHLRRRGASVERGTTLSSLHDDGDAVTCTLTTSDGATGSVRARYVVGCDGAHSTVRKLAGIPFLGAAYPQTFLLADVSVDGLETGAVHAYVTPSGPFFFFPLEEPAPWRVIVARPGRGAAVREEMPTETVGVDLAELQALCDGATDGHLRLRDAVWSTAFTVHHRHASTYRSGRAFLAGDAAHIHSPAGAQGMNTGIQDAVNLGWKLALVVRGHAPDALLDSYDVERRPVGAFVLRFTDRAFTAATSQRTLPVAARTHLAPRILPLLLRVRAGRRLAFRTVSQLGIRYPDSPAVLPAARGMAGRRKRRAGSRRGPSAGDRLPDARVVDAGRDSWLWLHEALAAPGFHLLLCGPIDPWSPTMVDQLCEEFAPLLEIHHLAVDVTGAVGAATALADPSGHALGRLGVGEHAVILVRPDGHIAHRADAVDLTGVRQYLRRWAGASPAR